MESLFVFVSTADKPPPEVLSRLASVPDQIQLASNVWLLRSEELVKDLSERLGVGEDPVSSGVVFRLNGTYWGRANANVWDWLSRA